MIVPEMTTQKNRTETKTKREIKPNLARMIPAMTAMAVGNRGVGGGLKLSGLDNLLLIM